MLTRRIPKRSDSGLGHACRLAHGASIKAGLGGGVRVFGWVRVCGYHAPGDPAVGAGCGPGRVSRLTMHDGGDWTGCDILAVVFGLMAVTSARNRI